ncbi:uroporphyrinogen-III synthase [Acetobacter fallax]|uniref:Uroporphyrinogen-III synthase n=1 Tax=Acetobacter fallax TaxID=1737473 RepID=A0ABX0K676_9PROT|nr:uroporphyrinogen-III synthase [Acetobacter fallax]NHO31801.1 uroporphyrinogen-III synthase [Acetobacter fallax]NHO35437.1 uroporphyrinogen-III synthase [Acetobacter fallax]
MTGKNVLPRRRTGVLIGRPEPGLSETMEAVRALGWIPYAAPALTIEPRVIRRQTGIAAVLLTSSQALPALAGAVGSDVPVFTVGDATARRVRAVGFRSVESAGADAVALVGLVRSRVAPAPVLLLSGAGQGLDLALALRQAGFIVRRRVAYAATPVRDLPVRVLNALRADEIGVVMAFSARSAAATGAALRASGYSGERMHGIAISENAAFALKKNDITDVVVAWRPDAEAMLAALGSVF